MSERKITFGNGALKAFPGLDNNRVVEVLENSRLRDDLSVVDLNRVREVDTNRIVALVAEPTVKSLLEAWDWARNNGRVLWILIVGDKAEKMQNNFEKEVENIK